MVFVRKDRDLRIFKTNISCKFLFISLVVLIKLSGIECSIHGPHTEAPSTRSWLDDVVKKSQLVDSDWHWLPWRQMEPYEEVANCTNKTSDADDFPADLFTDEQLRNGAIVLHFIGGIYSFTLLAVVCNDYFIPTVECICEDLHITPDVAAATFMAVATSSPELFVNIISTFITKSDLGIGTIVGSAMFNTLGVGAIGGLAASTPILIKRWPLTRDCIVYIIVVSILVTMTWDGRVEWWECTILIVLYFVYFIFMFNSKRIINFFRHLIFGKSAKPEKQGVEDDAIEDVYTARVSLILSKKRSTRLSTRIDRESGNFGSIQEGDEIIVEEPKKAKSLWRFPSEKSLGKKLWYIYTWPLKLLLTCLIPSPKTYRKLYPFSFFMCIVCIGGNSYFVSWMITTIGGVLGIPDSIMGMTFLAFGGCLPEACSIFIMSRRGEGGMGVSNSLGANSLAILFSLGIPWFAKSMILRSQGEDGYIAIESSGIDYIILSLILAVICLYTILYIGKFYLKKTVGAIIFTFYFVFIILAILMESGMFFEVGLPSC